MTKNNFSAHIHRFVRKSAVEELLVELRRRASFLRRFIPVSARHWFFSVGRFIPPSADYAKDDRYPLTRDGTNFIINRSDYVQWRLFYGVRDNALAQARNLLTGNSCVLDIGANFGAFSLRLASYAVQNNYRGFQLHAFEPNPVVQQNFRANLTINPSLADVIQLHPIGLGHSSGYMPFVSPLENSGAGRITTQETVLSSVLVPIQRLDDFVLQHNLQNIAFIKLIAGGYEVPVLRGGWQAILKFRPVLFIEVTRSWWKENGYEVAPVIEDLRSLGYQFSIEHHNELLPYVADRYAHRNQFNLLAVCAGSHRSA
jgi:FkbM family methyltransferase